MSQVGKYQNLLTILSIPVLLFLFVSFPELHEPYVWGKVLKFKDPSLFAKDLYLDSVAIAGPYNNYAYVLSWFPLSFIPYVLYIFWLSCFIGYFFWLEKIIEHFKLNVTVLSNRTLAYLVLIVHVLTIRLNGWGGFLLGDNEIFYSMLKGQTIGIIGSLWGLYYYWRKSYTKGLFFVSLFGFFHINTLQHFLIIMGVDCLFRSKREIINFIKSCLIVSPLVILNCIPFIKTEFLETNEPLSYIFASGYFRHPHHLILSTWEASDFLPFLSVFMIGIFFFFKFFRDTKDKKSLIRFFLLGIFLYLISFIFIEIVKIDIIAKFHFYRYVVYLKPFLLIFILNGLLKRLPGIKKLSAPFAILLIALKFGFYKDTGLTFEIPYSEKYEKFANKHKNAEMFIVPPLWGHNDIADFLLTTKKAIYFDFSRYPFIKGFEKEWVQRVRNYEINKNIYPVWDPELTDKQYKQVQLMLQKAEERYQH